MNLIFSFSRVLAAVILLGALAGDNCHVAALALPVGTTSVTATYVLQAATTSITFDIFFAEVSSTGFPGPSPVGPTIESGHLAIADVVPEKWDELEQYVVERIGFPKDIWEKTVAIGARLEELSHNLLEDATKQFEETKTQIGDLKETVGEIVSATADLRVGIQNIASAMGQTVLESSNDPSGVYLRGVEKSNDESRLMNSVLSLEQISVEVAQLHQRIIDEIEKDLPPPDHAPSHANREMMVDSILQRAESGFVDLVRTQGLAEEELDNLRETFGRIARPVKKLTVLVGMSISS